jgi:hypothetical protein
MLRSKDGDFFISDWLRNRNTIEFLGIWEKVFNPDSNYGEFALIKSQAGLNSYKISVKEWVAKTWALTDERGRVNGTAQGFPKRPARARTLMKELRLVSGSSSRKPRGWKTSMSSRKCCG